MKIIVRKLLDTYSKKLNALTNKIISNSGKPKSNRYLPKIDDNRLIKLEKSQKSCTIHNRFTTKYKRNKALNEQNNNLNKAIISLILSEKRWDL